MESDYKNIGARAKRLREFAKMTQEQVGKLLGVEKATVSKYETGDTKMNPRALVIYAQIGDQSVDWLLTGEDNILRPGNIALQKKTWSRVMEALDTSGVRVAELLQKTGKSQDHFNQYEKGQSSVPISVIRHVSLLTNIATDWFLYGEGPGPGEIKGHDYTNESPSDHEPSTINTNRLKQVVLMLEWYLAETKTKEIDPELRAEITVKMYDFYTDSNEEVSEQSFRRLMRLAI